MYFLTASSLLIFILVGGFCIVLRSQHNTLEDLVTHYSTKSDGICCRLIAVCPRFEPPATVGLSYRTKDEWEIDRSSITLKKKLGSGAFGEVWEGRWNENTPVAVKQLMMGSMAIQEFFAEAQVMKKLQHQNLIQLYAVCTEGDPIYIIMELMKNGNLLDYLRENKGQHMEMTHLLDMASQVASGMAYLEAQKYVHRDLAARNVLLGENNIVKIADFGLTRFIKDKDYVARAGSKFPIKWTAPEAVNYGRFNIKSDVWSFGIFMFELITGGKVPYAGMTNGEAFHNIENGYRLPPPPKCPEFLYNIMTDCWNEDPEERPTFDYLKTHLADYSELGKDDTGYDALPNCDDYTDLTD